MFGESFYFALIEISSKLILIHFFIFFSSFLRLATSRKNFVMNKNLEGKRIQRNRGDSYANFFG